MKGLAFTLVILLLLSSVCAETISDPWLVSSTTHEEVAPGGSGYYTGYNFGIETFTLGDAAQLRSMELYTIKIPNTYVVTTKDSDYSGVSFKIGADYVGSGLAGYNVGVDNTFVHYWFQDLDLSGYSGSQIMTVEGVPTTISTGNYYKDQAVPTNQQVYKRTYNAGRVEWYGWRQATHNIQMTYNFENTITVNFAEPLSSVTTYRDDGNQSMYNITQNGVQILYEDSLNTGTNVTYSNSTSSFTVTGENQYGDLYSHIFLGGVLSTGSIELNQTSYTEPELIQIDAELTTYDFDDHVYTTRLYGNTGSGWGALTYVNYNESIKMENTTKTIIVDLDLTFYDLPLQIKAVLLDFNKLDFTTTEIAESATVYYNPPDGGLYTFEGTVINAGNFGVIVGATVSVTGTISQSDTTDSNGKFKLYLPNGIYTVTGSKSGYIDNVNEDIVIAGNIVYFNIYLTQTSYTNHTVNGVIKDIDTGYALQDVHVIFTNATDTIDAYSTVTGYYSADGFAQSSTYTIQAVKSGYYTYNGSVTTEASGASHKSFNMVPETATPTPTATVLPTSTYPGGEGHEWTNDEIVTMLRVLVPGFFLLMLVFLLMAVMLGIGGNNGNGGQGRSGLSEIWRR